jgi:serine/threonine protein kinase
MPYSNRAIREPADADEPFELLDLLGVGGFAQTYQARVLDEALIDDFGTEIVALKVPLSRKKERVLSRELEMNAVLHARLRDLQSLNLVRYLGFAVFRGQIVMAMQYVAGGSLRKLIGDIGRQKPLPIGEAVRISEGVLKGLSAIHREHVFHRDIKPENILLEGTIPKISDLGISRMLETDELASTTTGTLYYMSPDILGDEGASFPSDIWSLGVTLYEMVTGRLPFGGPGVPMGTTLDQIRTATPVPARRLRPDLPEELERIIDISLRKDPRKRYASADEMLNALSKALKVTNAPVEKELESVRKRLGGMEPPADIERTLDQLVRKYPDEPRTYQYLGELYNRCQRYGDAARVFRSGLQRCPDNAVLHWDLALALKARGQKQEAVKNLEEAIRLGLDASLHRHATTLLKLLKGN